MNDLLGEVKGREGLGRRPASPAAAAAFDIEGGAPAANGRTADMDAFFKQVDDIKKDLTEIKALERQVIQMHDQSKTIVRQKDVQQHRADMQVSGAPAGRRATLGVGASSSDWHCCQHQV
jgi:hypothetical protein